MEAGTRASALDLAASALRRFLAPDWRKNVLFIVLFAYIFPLAEDLVLPQPISLETVGFPLTYFSYHVMARLTARFRFLPFVLDVLFCYVISCIAVAAAAEPRAKRSRLDRIVDYVTLTLVVAMLIAHVTSLQGSQARLGHLSRSSRTTPLSKHFSLELCSSIRRRA